ncbi:lectin-like domain-containing protein [Bombilactobacillus bombi]|uniref:lectin-like domain-containing protein n=1 Tax=Bombilactobacillus bombi TaxID=1303590 RepID=UPI0015E61E63|nr:hypothetical protein [Bombilactobacillus bombi]MBA1433655.1 hypothetical protein [Bombilactobacillus bombi]
MLKAITGGSLNLIGTLFSTDIPTKALAISTTIIINFLFVLFLSSAVLVQASNKLPSNIISSLPLLNESGSSPQSLTTFSSNPLSVLVTSPNQLLRDSASLNPISITTDDTQNFFSPKGTAIVNASQDGTWNTIDLNPDEGSKVGAVTLNTAIDMSKDFDFSWKVKISAASTPGDGIGFVVHPLYKPGQTITDPTTSQSITLPDVFGRHADGTRVNDPADPDNGQNIDSVGVAGGNLGIGDLMNSFGFKIDTYYNGTETGSKGSVAGSFYGDQSHDNRVVYGDLDSKINSNAFWSWDKYTKPFGTFVTTDITGYSNINKNYIKLDSGNVKITDGNWWQMHIQKVNTTVTVTIFDPNKPNKNESISTTVPSLDHTKDYKYAFGIVSSTGLFHESNQIKDVEGTFTPAEPTLITRYTDENGTDLQQAKITTLSDNGNNYNFTDINDKPTLADKDGKNYQRAQVNGTLYTSSGLNTSKIFKQLTNNTPIGNNQTNVSNDAQGNLAVKSTFNNLIVLNYVYRRQLPPNSSDITTNLQLKVGSNGSYGSTANVSPGDTVTFKYSVTNNSGPNFWKNVTAVQSLAGFLDPPNPLTSGLEEKSGLLYIPLFNQNNNNSNNLSRGDTGSNTVTFTYKGANQVRLTAQDNGQVKVNAVLPSAPNSTPQAEITSKVAIYDQSSQLVDTDGNSIYGSYFYCIDNDKSPLAKQAKDSYNLGNYVLETSATTLDELLWWWFDNGKLTIYPHKIDLDVTSADKWPWDSKRKDITKVEVKPGVSAEKSINYMFANMPINEIDLSDFDMSNVTDASAMFQGDDNLWKITLGPKVKFPLTSADNPIMPAPGNNTPFPEDHNYSSRSSNWQEVGTGSDYEPTGKVISAADLSKYSGDSNNNNHTYVWEPFLSGYLTLTKVPDNLDYGNNILGMIHILTTSDSQDFQVDDDRPLRAGRHWHVDATASPLILDGNSSTKISDVIEFKLNGTTHILSSHPYSVYSTASNTATKYQWNYTGDNGIQLNIKNNSVPKAGKYKGAITYTLVDAPN